MWDAKMDPAVYAVYLTRTKDYARLQFMRYQVVHEELIRIVKDVTSRYPSESARQHAYMWYAQGLWYCTQRYKSKALQTEADALFVYFYLLGLNDECLREIASRLGIKISDWLNILGRLPMSQQIIYEGVKKALAETLHKVEVNTTDTQIEYDPATGLPIKITVTDTVTGKTKIIHIEYDAQGNPIRIWEEWGS